MNIIVDAMGSDNGPEAIVNGCIDALNEELGFDVTLVGDENEIKKAVEKRNFDSGRLKIRHASEVVTNADKPSRVVREKKDSSMVVGFNMIKENEGDVLISCGNTGALLSCGILVLKRLKGIVRPALGSIIPAKTGYAMIIDAGLNTNCKPINYYQFGVLGSFYMKANFNMDKPRVGIVNVGSEEEKGTDEIKEGYKMLKESSLNFVGNVEGNDVMLGKADVVVCDGFLGNVMLKLLEGTSEFLFGEIKSILRKNILTTLAAAVLKKGFGSLKDKVDPDIQGGAPILGLDGLVLKSHGNSNAKTIKNVVIKGYTLAKAQFLDSIKAEFTVKADVSE